LRPEVDRCETTAFRIATAVAPVHALNDAFFVSVAIVVTHKFREPIGDPPSAAYRPVTFRASDGLDLSGWYRSSRNRAAVVIVHGGGGDRTGSVRHAALLVRHGYGVVMLIGLAVKLAVDSLRGRTAAGASEGR
jgi:hypothetical protein